VAPEGVTKYLTTIIANELRWIKEDAEREEIWEQASKRLSERSGRSAMPSMTRTFTIPAKSGQVELVIHEPALTSDNLGFKTWAASYLLAKRLRHLDIPCRAGQALRILELGSGTGLVGMAAAGVLSASVLLTDLPDIEGNLTRNVEQNQLAIQALGGSARTAILDWNSPDEIFPSGHDTTVEKETLAPFPVIVAADAVYDKEHPAMLTKAISVWLAVGPDARFVVELPRRNGFNAELNSFKQEMLGIGLAIMEEGYEVGFDDWAGATQGELQEIDCWWSVWGWKA
jgi:predicted nicotinamide N-methyase